MESSTQGGTSTHSNKTRRPVHASYIWKEQILAHIVIMFFLTFCIGRILN
ncbi:hypothetical protein BLGI_3380 [Brevibacillus laterosporus GI-9]|nr:hypothetical protein BLGI_3380 [Brevibacillus laterosporus GI-9]